MSVDLRGLRDYPLDALRLMLVADVLRRVEEEFLDARPLTAILQDSGGALGAVPAAARLAIREPSFRTSSPTEAEAFLGGPADVTLQAARPVRAVATSLPAQRALWIGTVTLRARGGYEPLTPALVVRDCDPLALRLALLHVAYASPLLLSLARLHRAEETLQRWRIKVAGWRDMPPGPVPDTYEAVRHALVFDLDTSAALRLLHRLEIDPRRPSGAKFEVFTDLDCVLALDLQRLAGKLRR